MLEFSHRGSVVVAQPSAGHLATCIDSVQAPSIFLLNVLRTTIEQQCVDWLRLVGADYLLVTWQLFRRVALTHIFAKPWPLHSSRMGNMP